MHIREVVISLCLKDIPTYDIKMQRDKVAEYLNHISRFMRIFLNLSNLCHRVNFAGFLLEHLIRMAS